MPSRYHVCVTRSRDAGAYGCVNEIVSVQLFDSSVTASAITAVAACAPANVAPVAFQSPCTYTGFSATTVKPVTP